MKIADHIKASLDACDSKELDKAMLFACLAVDGTAKKMYPNLKVGERFRKFRGGPACLNNVPRYLSGSSGGLKMQSYPRRRACSLTRA